MMGRGLQYGQQLLGESARAQQEASQSDAQPEIGDATCAGELRERGWRLVPQGEAGHLFEKANLRGRPGLALFDEPSTPRYYPYGSARNAGEAHKRMHIATRNAGIQLQGGTPSMSDSEILDAYTAAYADTSETGIRGDLRTPDGKTVLGANVAVQEAWQLLLEWAGLAEGGHP